ncbi:MAG: hypothetical protein GEU79_00650 [Acidimicrobiia bacterium]|nr:hypothetical protein [Acidimicrobiia bacterium]
MSVAEIRLPALSATMESARLLRWLVSPGAEVSEGQPIAEVGTDKVDMEFESPHTGTIAELVAEEGDDVPLGGVLALIETEADDLLGGLALGEEKEPDTPAEDIQPRPDSTAAALPGSDTPSTGIIPAAPPARKLAEELGVDLSTVTPSGRRGQVTSADVRSAAESATPATVEPATTPIPPPTPSTDRRAGSRKATAAIMETSAQIPQFTLYRTVDLTAANDHRGSMGWTTALVRAIAIALRQHPEMAMRWDGNGVVAMDGEIGVGIAIDRPDLGLTVATITDPDALDRDAANQAVRALADRARSNRVRPEDMAPATSTLSNLGGLRIDRFNALLFPPQASILSAGTIRYRPLATGDGALKAVLTVELGLTVDHRVADGADGARFLDTIVESIGQ